MKKKILLITALALICSAILFLPNLFAFDPPVGGKWWYRPGVKDKLQLTPDQINKINKIWMEHRKRIIDIKSDIGKTYLDLENIMAQPMADRQGAYKLAERLGHFHSQQTEERIRMAIDIRQELSIEQFEKLKGLRREFA
ncbi:MAG: periplasmic heavy metal sensor, partial [Desulfobacteraceae bacterium]